MGNFRTLGQVAQIGPAEFVAAVPADESKGAQVLMVTEPWLTLAQEGLVTLLLELRRQATERGDTVLDYVV